MEPPLNGSAGPIELAWSDRLYPPGSVTERGEIVGGEAGRFLCAGLVTIPLASLESAMRHGWTMTGTASPDPQMVQVAKWKLAR